jgi:hypothetical protein
VLPGEQPFVGGHQGGTMIERGRDDQSLITCFEDLLVNRAATICRFLRASL